MLAPCMVEGLPSRWVSRLNATLAGLLAAGPSARDPRAVYVGDAWARVETVADAVRGQVLPANATDSDVLALAERFADECVGDAVRYRDAESLRARCEVIAKRVQIAPLDAAIDDVPAVRRYCDRKWWTRRLREAHGRACENGSMRLGFVHKRGDVYVSNEGVARHLQKVRRNARILEATRLANEDGEVFTLAELAAKSVSNKAIRRGELMARIRGMEEVARESKRVALFAVLTAPGYMHATYESGHLNAKHDGSTARQVQAWHAANWKKATAALHRAKSGFYGARTVEPHHDGTPHWNVLLFLPAEGVAQAEAILRRYWLDNCSPDEPGAQEHRVRFTRINDSMGGATSYIAKYISKGIDGHGVSEDLFGNPIIETTTRIEAWARTHGIRQFQTMCSASVTIWRELRRVQRETMVAAQPTENLIVAWNACQKVAGDESSDGKRADFAEFIKAYGGPRVSRKDRQMALDLKPGEGETRYGEEAPPKPCGVWAAGDRWRGEDKGGLAGWIEWRVRGAVTVASLRRKWVPVRSDRPAASLSMVREVAANGGVGVTRTRVNNYTRPASAERPRCYSGVDVDGFKIGEFRRKDGPPSGGGGSDGFFDGNSEWNR